MITKSTTTSVARKPTQRALSDCRTMLAARSGVSSNACALAGAEKRGAGAGWASGRRAGSRCSGGVSGWSVIAMLLGQRKRARSDAPGRRLGRDEAGLAERDRQRTERDLARIEPEGA